MRFSTPILSDPGQTQFIYQVTPPNGVENIVRNHFRVREPSERRTIPKTNKTAPVILEEPDGQSLMSRDETPIVNNVSTMSVTEIIREQSTIAANLAIEQTRNEMNVIGANVVGANLSTDITSDVTTTTVYGNDAHMLTNNNVTSTTTHTAKNINTTTTSLGTSNNVGFCSNKADSEIVACAAALTAAKGAYLPAVQRKRTTVATSGNKRITRSIKLKISDRQRRVIDTDSDEESITDNVMSLKTKVVI